MWTAIIWVINASYIWSKYGLEIIGMGLLFVTLLIGFFGFLLLVV